MGRKAAVAPAITEGLNDGDPAHKLGLGEDTGRRPWRYYVERLGSTGQWVRIHTARVEGPSHDVENATVYHTTLTQKNRCVHEVPQAFHGTWP